MPNHSSHFKIIRGNFNAKVGSIIKEMIKLLDPLDMEIKMTEAHGWFNLQWLIINMHQTQILRRKMVESEDRDIQRRPEKKANVK